MPLSLHMASFLLGAFFFSSTRVLSISTECEPSETCSSAYMESDAVDSPQLGAVMEDAGVDGEFVSFTQLRSRQLGSESNAISEHRVIPEGDIIWMLEAYVVEFKTYDIEICRGDKDALNWTRTATIGQETTGCLNVTNTGDWFAASGFNDCYQRRVGIDPEVIVTFEAFQNNDGDRCIRDPADSCHVFQSHLVSATEITRYDEWIPGKLGDSSLGHEMFFYYKLSVWTTTTTTTSTTTTETTTTTTTTTTTIFLADCKIFGDPHIIGFDKASNFLSFGDATTDPLGMAVDNFDRGDFWLVKSPLVHIQGRYNVVNRNRKHSFLRVLAVGGPFLGNNTLVIGNRRAKVKWNDYEILPAMGSEFRNRFIKARYHQDSKLVQDFNRSAPGTDIDLPLNVNMLVNRGKNGVGVMITMPRFEGGQDGQCGNFNGDANDDTAAMISHRMGGDHIMRDELLFKHTLINP